MTRAPLALALALALAAPAAGAAATGDRGAPPRDATADTAGARMPKNRDYSYVYDLFDQLLVRPATRFFDLARLGRKITRHPREAANVDEHDQVRLPSTWWQPRIGFRPVTVEQMLRGPGPGTGPAPGKWTVTKAKSQGVTPGFQVEDAQGGRFIIKFDPPAFPEMATAADVIGSRLFWAAGYNVPDNAITTFRFEDLVIKKGATYTASDGHKHPITPTYLKELLGLVAQRPDGSYRCVASRFLEGKPLGPFRYEKRRRDDPEDLIPHELRRELRGLWTFAAWVNHSDSRGANSLDTWVSEGGRSFVRHHLIDFGSILGSSALPIKRDLATGFEYYVDFGTMARRIGTLGVAPSRWEAVTDPRIAEVGFVESREFDPGGWRPDYPNPAFDDRTERDVRWGARIVAGFTDAHIRAAVALGRYSDPRAADYLVHVLIERRDKLVRRWLGAAAADSLAAPPEPVQAGSAQP